MLCVVLTGIFSRKRAVPFSRLGLWYLSVALTFGLIRLIYFDRWEVWGSLAGVMFFYWGVGRLSRGGFGFSVLFGRGKEGLENRDGKP